MTELSIINDAIKSGFDYVINSVMYGLDAMPCIVGISVSHYESESNELTEWLDCCYSFARSLVHPSIRLVRFVITILTKLTAFHGHKKLSKHCVCESHFFAMNLVFVLWRLMEAVKANKRFPYSLGTFISLR